MDANLTLETVEFHEHTLNLAILMPPMAAWLQTMLFHRYHIELLPILHTLGYRHCIYVDVQDKFGMGPNAMISLAGSDKRKCLIVSRSILDYLEQ